MKLTLGSITTDSTSRDCLDEIVRVIDLNLAAYNVDYKTTLQFVRAIAQKGINA